MTWLDAAVIGIVAVYGVLGIWTGLIRRLVGAVAVYAGFLAATFMGASGYGVVQQLVTLSNPEARLVAFFATLLLVVLVTEAVATVYHSKLQIAVVPADRFTGLVAGLVVGIAFAGLVVILLQGYGHPFGNGQLTSAQIRVRDTYDSSWTPSRMQAMDGALQRVFYPVFPRDPTSYFGTAAG